MHIVRISDADRKRHAGPLFTSDEVFAQPLAPQGSEFNCSVVAFGKGVRNKFHTHESTQILIVTEGKGIVSTETEQREVTVGDVIFFPPGEVHWHGATSDSEFAHVYVSLASSKTQQIER